MTPRNFTWLRCQQLAEQVFFCDAAKPTKMLEIGPGDYTVTAIFRNLGVTVETVDIGEDLRATYRGDIRDPELVAQLAQDYDLILASEVLEHMDFKYLDGVLATFRSVLRPGGHVVIGLPYHTAYLMFRSSRPFFRGGVIDIGIPRQWIRNLFFMRSPFKPAAEDAYEIHHWDLGYRPTRVRTVQKIMARYFEVVTFHRNLRAGSGYFVLQK